MKTTAAFPIDNEWKIVEPGLLNLPTTQYTIRLLQEHNRWPAYEITWAGNVLELGGVPITCAARAKALVNIHMQELLAVGIEP